MAVEKKEAAKTVEVKAPETKTPVAKAPVTKTPTTKVPAVSAAEPKKDTAKKAPAAKKPAAKKADPKASVVIEYAGKTVVAKDMLATATKAFAKSHKGVAIKTIDIYVKPEENVAYYVVNGEGSDEYKIEL